MSGYPPVPPPVPPPGYDPRGQRRFFRDQARAQRAAFRAQRDQMRFQMRSMRRGSVVGPILLIAIGIVFLLIESGHLDHMRFWDWYGHWWPLLLVGAGLVVLAEWAIDQYGPHDPQRPGYRRSFGGGVVFLLLALGFAGVIAGHGYSFARNQGDWMFPGFHFDQDSMDQFFGDKHESDQTLDAAFPAGGSLAVMNPRGDVTVNGTSDDGRVHIAVHKQIYSRTDSEAESKAQQFNPEVTTDGNAVSIRMPAMDGTRGDLVITVPAEAATTVTANHGDIHVASIKAAVFTTANHGDTELSAITGAASAHINSGGSSITAHSIDGGVSIQGRAQDITVADIGGPVTVTGDFFGTTHMERIRGAIHFHTSRTDLQFGRLDGQTEISADGISADQAAGPVVLTTSNRNINLDRMAGDISVSNRNGAIDLIAAPVLGNITLDDRNGSIRATLPDKASFSVQAGTSDGNIDTDFQLTTTRSSDNGRTLSGSVGAGGPVVHIATTNGDISVHKGDVAPLPATPPAPPKITLAPPAAPKTPANHKAAKAPAVTGVPTN